MQCALPVPCHYHRSHYCCSRYQTRHHQPSSLFSFRLHVECVIVESHQSFPLSSSSDSSSPIYYWFLKEHCMSHCASSYRQHSFTLRRTRYVGVCIFRINPCVEPIPLLVFVVVKLIITLVVELAVVILEPSHLVFPCHFGSGVPVLTPLCSPSCL